MVKADPLPPTLPHPHKHLMHAPAELKCGGGGGFTARATEYDWHWQRLCRSTCAHCTVCTTIDCPLSALTPGCASKQRLIGFMWGFQMRCLPLFTLVIDSIAAFLCHLSLSLPISLSFAIPFCFPVQLSGYIFVHIFFCVHFFICLVWCVPHFLIMHTHVFEIYSAQTSIRLKAVEVDKDFPFFHDDA